MQANTTINGGLFITFEGPEGSGKSTQAKLLVKKLKDCGYNVLHTREPGGTVAGEELRHIVKHLCGEDAVCDEAEILIFSASRAQLVRKVILPQLEKGGIIVCDRFADSTTAYQGYARGIDLEKVNMLHSIATCGKWPDLTILMDIDISKGFTRTKTRTETQNMDDRIENESRDFHQKVREGYLKLAELNPKRIKTVNADDSIDAIQENIWQQILKYIIG